MARNQRRLEPQSFRLKAAGIVAAAAAMAAVFLYVRGGPSQGSELNEGPLTALADAPKAPRTGPLPARAASDGEQPLTAEELARLAADVGEQRARLTSVVGKMALLEELVRHLERRYPSRWRLLLARLLQEHHPELAGELLALLEATEEYERELAAQHAELVRLSPDERQKRLWQIRREAFGEDAEELFAEAARAETVSDVLNEIDDDPQGTVQARFEQYLGAVRDSYDEDSSQVIAAERQEIVDRFLSLESTQVDLAALEGDERYRALRNIREAAGMSEDALARWDQLDRLRGQRWAVGESYMKARSDAEATLEGDSLSARIVDLRAKAFGPEAEVVAAEEASGYFRFREGQVYGRN